jgi:hypothetical protein
LWIALGIAQDSAILLACLALSAWFLRRDRAFLCGVVLAICCFKANLLVAIPIVLIVRRMGRVCAGFAAGGAVLWLISAIAAGPGWLLDYIAAIQHTRQVLPMQTNFASMAGLVQSLPDGWRWIRWPVVLAIVCVLWSASRRVSEDRALSLALMAGLLMTPFAFLYDAAVMLPGIIGASEDRDPVLPCVFVALGLASLNVINPQTAWIGQCSLVLSFGVAVWSMH